MVGSDTHPQQPVVAPMLAASDAVPDAGFEARWAAWIARGRAHEQRVRRRFVTWLSIAVVGTAIVYGFLR
jgi:hypothetical protein